MKYAQNLSSTRRRTRGSALLLVVVLVVLLALMGYAFLFAMRAARVQAANLGSPVLPQGSWPAVDPNAYQQARDEGLAKATREILEGVWNGTTYLASTSIESRSTHPQDSVYLADRFPIPDPTNLSLLRWQYISDPDGTARNDAAYATANQDLYISQYVMGYPATFPPLADGTSPYPMWAQQALSNRVRVFPGFTLEADSADAPAVTVANTNRFLAADADGDGIADSRVMWTPSHVGALVGSSDTVIMSHAVRIIDNNAAISLNTAWRNYDRDFLGADLDPATDELYGYIGAFRPSIGLRELIAGEASDNTEVAGIAAADSDIGRLDTLRFAGSYADLLNIYEGNETATTAGNDVGDYVTAGDALEHGLASRVDDDTLPGFYTSADRFKKFASNAQDQLAFRFLLVNPKFDSGTLVSTLANGAYSFAPNVRNGEVVQQFRFYGADQAPFWYYSNFETDHTTGTSGRARMFGVADPLTRYPQHTATTFDPANGKTIRPHLTRDTGVTVSTPTVALTAGLVTPNPNPATWDTQMAGYAANRAPRKAWANGASFGELWRAYYDLFVANGINQDQVLRFPTDLTGWDAQRQMVLRSAMAALNTIQARKPADDPTEVRDIVIGGTTVTIYGAKPQPFITEVIVETQLRDRTSPHDPVGNPVEVQWVAVELHNPYSFDLEIDQERLFAVDGTTWTQMADLAGEAVITAGDYRTIGVMRTTYLDPPPAAVDTWVTASATTDQLLTDLPAQGSIRLMGWDANTAATSAGYDMIPHDEVPLENAAGTPNIALATFGQRFQYARPTQSPQGSRFVCVYNDPDATYATFNYSVATGWPAASAGTLSADNTGATGRDELVIQVGNYHPYMENVTGFPFDGFARDGDLLHVAYTGAYYVAGATPFTSSVTRDCFYAEDQNAATDAYEAVGRFVPMTAANFAAGLDVYDWTARLFDFVTAIQHPAGERVPDNEASVTELEPLPAGDTADIARTRSVQGKLNINTAGWQAIAALPLIPVNPNVPAIATEALARAETNKLAQAIVAYRQTNGPFRSIMDLNLVPGFAWRTAGVPAAADLLNNDLAIAPLSPTSVGYGDTSPLDAAIGDFEARLQGLTRISNLVTTRSDSFTVYILAQAWLRDPTTNSITTVPVLVGEHRSAYVIDRTGITPASTTLQQDSLDLTEQ